MKIFTTLFALGLLCTGNLHAQWTNTAPDGNNYPKIRFTSASIGYAQKQVGSSAMGLVKTTNAGASWTAVPFNPILNLHDFYFLDDNVGFACADTAGSTFPYNLSLYKTTNGGNTWTTVHVFAGGTPYNSRVYFTDALHGVVTETYSNIWYTSDGGVTWSSQAFDYAYFSDIEFTSPGVGYISCADGTFSYYGLVLKTTNGGATWNEVFDFGDIPLTYSTAGAISFLNDNTGYMMTMNNFYKTTNGGVSWDSLPYAVDHDLYFQDIHFTSLNVGYGCTSLGGIYKTTDGGNTWAVDLADDSVSVLSSIAVSNSTAYISGSNGKIWKRGLVNSVQELNNKNNLNIYPNPSCNGVLYFDINQAVDIEVYDAKGELVTTFENLTGNRLDLSANDNGIYFIRLHDKENGVRTGKVMIAK